MAYHPKPQDLEPHIEDILEKVIDGLTYREIAENYNVSISYLHKFLNSEKHFARAKAAFELSAASYYDLAEKAIKEAEGSMPEMQRAKLLVDLYTKKAGKRNPKQYGEKIEHGGDLGLAITWNETKTKPDNE